jgi:hypothetical protein
VANEEFASTFGECHMENLITTSSDHYAIWLRFDSASDKQYNTPVQHGFRYEAAWRRAESYSEKVEQLWRARSSWPASLHSTWTALKHTAVSLQMWSRDTFLNVARKIRRLEK